MEQRSLILLGLLMSESQHGYQLNDFIEKNLSTMTNMKKPTAYATLEKLCNEGYIEVQVEQEGNRPPRKVFSINEEGKQYFYTLLISNLSSAENVNFQGDIGLMFLDHLPINKAIEALEERLNQTMDIVMMLEETPSHGKGTGIDIAIEHKITMLKAEVSFIEKTVEKLHLKKQGNIETI